MGLGINKDLEPLAREIRRRGGTVTVTGSTHVRWTLGDWTLHSGLTMSSSTAHGKRREIEAHLAALDAPPVAFTVTGPTDRGKYTVHGPDGPVTNAAGYPRTFSSATDARRTANSLNRAANSATGEARPA